MFTSKGCKEKGLENKSLNHKQSELYNNKF